MARGSSRHLLSNGGIERMNCTVQRNLGAWVDETQSQHLSVGCKLVQWRINTQINRTIGNETSYQLAVGQKRRVGLSALPLHTELINTITTEGHLNRILGRFICNFFSRCCSPLSRGKLPPSNDKMRPLHLFFLTRLCAPAFYDVSPRPTWIDYIISLSTIIITRCLS
jgi:hypothetical protein